MIDKPSRRWALFSAILLASPASWAATVNVTTTNDVVGGAGTSLREAFNIANTDGVDTEIVLAPDATYILDLCASDEDANLGGDLDHTEEGKALTIVGNGATIQQTCAGERVIHYYVDFSDDGKVWDSAATAASKLTIMDVTITGGSAASDGGGINSPGWVELIEATVTGNTSGGGVYAGRSNGIIVSGDVLTVTNSTITSNTGYGLRGIEGGCTIHGSNISGNMGDGFRPSFCSVFITATVVSGNSGIGVGGVDANLTIGDNSTISNNGEQGVRTTFPQVFSISDSTVSSNGLRGVEGSHCDAFDLSNTTVDGNQEGGILLTGPGYNETVVMMITDSTITNNQSSADGAGISIPDDMDDGRLRTLYVTNTTISNNRNKAEAFTDGGGIFMDRGQLLVRQSSVIRFNSVEGSGGGIDQSEDLLRITDSTVSDNQAASFGGGLRHMRTEGSLILFGSTVSRNSAAHGGGIAVDDGSARIESSTVSGNTSVATGAGLWARDSRIVLEQSSFTGNTATAVGGGVYLLEQKLDSASLSVFGSTISENTAPGGAGVSVDTRGTVNFFKNTTISGNTGGGILAGFNTPINLAHATVVENCGINITTEEGELTTFASVIALAADCGIAADCKLGGAINSLGYNFDGDGTCGLGAVGDTSGGGNPQLGALGDNGGPTLTHLPAPSSPLIDAVASGPCSSSVDTASSDQRGLPRPVGDSCDIGSVEAPLNTVIADPCGNGDAARYRFHQRYEAESADLHGAESMNDVPGYSGAGFADFQAASGDYISWDISLPGGGGEEEFVLQFRYGLGRDGDRPLKITVADLTVPSLSFPETGSWSTWETVAICVTLPPGDHTVRAEAIGASGPNIDYLKVLGEYDASLPAAFQPPLFRRGDGNGDGAVDLSDATKILSFLFLGDVKPACMDAADSNDDSQVDLSDATTVLSYLFLGNASVPFPGAKHCGNDTTTSLGCEKNSSCN